MANFRRSKGVDSIDFQTPDEVVVFSKPEAGAFDLYDDGVMQQPVEQSGREHRVAEHIARFSEATIGGQDHGASLATMTVREPNRGLPPVIFREFARARRSKGDMVPVLAEQYTWGVSLNLII